jgi:twitching motility two-component system response regulator PilG
MKTILLIDGDPVSTIRISEILHHTRRRLLHVSDAEQGKRLLRDDRPDLVIYHLPENRPDVHKTLQSMIEALHTHNIGLLCLMEHRGFIDEAPEILGPKQYLKKPFTRDELLGAVEDHLTRGNRDRATTTRQSHRGPGFRLR